MTVSVEEPDCDMETGFRVAVILAVVPVRVRLTVPTNPFIGVIVIVNIFEEPRGTAWLVGDADIVKLPRMLTISFTVRV